MVGGRKKPMAVAIPAPRINDVEVTASGQATTWASISALIAVGATVPFSALLAKPVASIMFVRGEGSWAYVMMIVLIMTAPASYALFFGTAGELLKPRMSADAHRSTMRIAAAGMVPYLVLVVGAIAWASGPQATMLMLAGLTIPVAMAATIWSASRSDAARR